MRGKERGMKREMEERERKRKGEKREREERGRESLKWMNRKGKGR